jgi:hypothetical protein
MHYYVRTFQGLHLLQLWTTKIEYILMCVEMSHIFYFFLFNYLYENIHIKVRTKH